MEAKLNTITITIPGAPIAKKRPKFFRRGPFVGAYNPQETEEGKWLWSATQSMGGPDFGILSDPVELSMSFYMPIPSSISAKKKQELKHHIKKPDIDNLQKFCLDCLNGVLFRDDRQVYKIEAVKLYSEDPRTQIEVRW